MRVQDILQVIETIDEDDNEKIMIVVNEDDFEKIRNEWHEKSLWDARYHSYGINSHKFKKHTILVFDEVNVNLIMV